MKYRSYFQLILLAFVFLFLFSFRNDVYAETNGESCKCDKGEGFLGTCSIAGSPCDTSDYPYCIEGQCYANKNSGGGVCGENGDCDPNTSTGVCSNKVCGTKTSPPAAPTATPVPPVSCDDCVAKDQTCTAYTFNDNSTFCVGRYSLPDTALCKYPRSGNPNDGACRSGYCNPSTLRCETRQGPTYEACEGVGYSCIDEASSCGAGLEQSSKQCGGPLQCCYDPSTGTEEIPTATLAPSTNGGGSGSGGGSNNTPQAQPTSTPTPIPTPAASAFNFNVYCDDGYKQMQVIFGSVPSATRYEVILGGHFYYEGNPFTGALSSSHPISGVLPDSLYEDNKDYTLSVVTINDGGANQSSKNFFTGPSCETSTGQQTATPTLKPGDPTYTPIPTVKPGDPTYTPTPTSKPASSQLPAVQGCPDVVPGTGAQNRCMPGACVAPNTSFGKSGDQACQQSYGDSTLSCCTLPTSSQAPAFPKTCTTNIDCTGAGGYCNTSLGQCSTPCPNPVPGGGTNRCGNAPEAGEVVYGSEVFNDCRSTNVSTGGTCYFKKPASSTPSTPNATATPTSSSGTAATATPTPNASTATATPTAKPAQCQSKDAHCYSGQGSECCSGTCLKTGGNAGYWRCK